jgi:hypothetical protein
LKCNAICIIIALHNGLSGGALLLNLFISNRRLARKRWGLRLDNELVGQLKYFSETFNFSLASGDLSLLDERWYVTHAGLLRLAHRKRCYGIRVKAVPELCDLSARRYAFEATVYVSRRCRGFIGYGDADPSNVSPVMHGAEMRVAETRSVSRALRKAYGIPVCSIEELGASAEPAQSRTRASKLPPQSANGNSSGSRVRDRLCQIIRQHQLDPVLVKSYATDFCAVKTLREATREQVESFVGHLADWAEKDRNALLCQLNSYLSQKEGAA